MIQHRDLSEAIRLHEKAYGLFRWLNSRLKKGKARFETVVASMQLAREVKQWLTRNRADLPEGYRPELEELDPFSNLFASYLATSYTVVKGAVVGACGGCFCCGVLELPNHLRIRKITPQARRDAVELKRLFLEALADERKRPGSRDRIVELSRAESPLKSQVAMATYATQLIRRMEFPSQGPGLLVLWREFAWNAKGAPRKGFKLKSRDVLQAEKKIVTALADDCSP